MKEKKNIDRLFQEKFKNFEAHPSSDVWKKIATAQKEKNDRTIIPIWWKFAGTAAALAILFGLGTFIFDDKPTTGNTTPLVLQETTHERSLQSDLDKDSAIDAKVVATSDDKTHVIDTEPAITKDTLLYKTNGIVTASNPEDSIITSKDNTSDSYPEKTTLVANETNAASKATKMIEDQVNGALHSMTNDSHALSHNESIAVNDRDIPSTESDSKNVSEKADTDLSTLQNDISKVKDLVAEAEKISVAQNEDTTPIDDFQKKDRWGVGAVAAPVYYGNFGGSGLDPTFKDNDKSGNVNLSYGVQVSYAVSPKLKIRTGVSNVDLSYNTNDLAFSTNSFAGRQLDGVSYSLNGSGITISDASAGDMRAAEPGLLPGPRPNFKDGSVRQRLNYIEVPVEAVYTLSEKRLGVSVIGGISTLLLNDNDVLLLSDDLNTSLGTSNSVNDVSFTTNIGLGLDYKITEEFKLNVEPAFKYQINGYDDSVGEFKPYYLGVYTGFSYKF